MANPPAPIGSSSGSGNAPLLPSGAGGGTTVNGPQTAPYGGETQGSPGQPGYMPGIGGYSGLNPPINGGNQPVMPSGFGPVTQWGSIANPNPYQPGDEWKPADNPEEILPLQEELVTAGLLSAADVRPGVWDAQAASAYQSALELANYYHADVNSTLTMLAQNAKVGSSRSGFPRAPFPITNPATISAEVSTLNGRNTAQDLIGQNLPAGQTADFVKFYQNQETAARKQYMAADMSGPGNFYTQAPSLTAAAQEYIKSHDLQASISYGVAQRALQFFSMLKGAGGTAASL